MLSSRILPFVSLAVFAFATASDASQPPVDRVYVDVAAPAGGDGHSWQTAYASLDVALLRAPSGAHVWVRAGHYKPAYRTVVGDPRSATFWVARDLKVYGGFAGDETTLAERAGLFRATILDGDIGVENDDTDNVDHVVRVSGPASVSVGALLIDGFTIINGNSRTSGGGIFDTPVPTNPQPGRPGLFEAGNLLLRNCTVMKNKAATSGGGLSSQLGQIDIAWCTFAENSANSGGAVYPQACAMHVYNSRFIANHAEVRGGAFAAVSTYFSPETGPKVWFINTLFDRNTAQQGGAGYLGGSQYTTASAAWGNCTFKQNEATTVGGAIAVRPSPNQLNAPHAFVYNAISWGNTAPLVPEIGVTAAAPPLFVDIQVHQSIVQGGFPGDNASIDPKFADIDGRLAPDSPAIDAGNSGFLPMDWIDLDQDQQSEVLPLDLGIVGRFKTYAAANPALPGVDPYGVGGVVDLGAHEFQPAPVLKP